MKQESVEQTVTVTETQQVQDSGVYLEAARILSNVPNCKQEIINCLRHVVPDIDQMEVQETTTEVKTEVKALPDKERASAKGYSIAFNRSKFNDYLYEYRISVSDLASMIGCCKSSVSGWKTGKAAPGEFYRKRICEVLNLPNTYFNSRRTRRTK